LEFDVWIVDDRAEFVAEERFPKAERRIAGPIDRVLPDLEITRDTYCLIVTRGHNHDQEALFHLVNRGARYVGLIGSRRKIKMIFENLAAEGVSAESLATSVCTAGNRHRLPDGAGDRRQHLCRARRPSQPGRRARKAAEHRDVGRAGRPMLQQQRQPPACIGAAAG
jgi:hypothetical protein